MRGIELAVVVLAGVDDSAHVGEPVHIDAGPVVVLAGPLRLVLGPCGIPASHHPLREPLAKGALDGSKPRRCRRRYRPKYLRGRDPMTPKRTSDVEPVARTVRTRTLRECQWKRPLRIAPITDRLDRETRIKQQPLFKGFALKVPLL